MRRFHTWYMKKSATDLEHFIVVRVQDTHYFNGVELFYLDFKDIYEIYHRGASTFLSSAARFCKCACMHLSLGVVYIFIIFVSSSQLLSTDCRMEIQRCRQQGIYNVGFMDPVAIN